MDQLPYPLHVIQHYTLSRREAEDFLDLMARLSKKSLEKISTVSRKRLDVVPIAARVLHRLLRRIAAMQLVSSAFGLREGHLYCLLDEDKHRADPLLTGCADAAVANRRFGADGEELFAWIAPLFPNEDEERRRLRHAAALLSDIAWHEHPDYRAEQALRSVLYMPVAGVDHHGRAYLPAPVSPPPGRPHPRPAPLPTP